MNAQNVKAWLSTAFPPFETCACIAGLIILYFA